MTSPRPSTLAVFLREARRSSRRWQTYALRMTVALGGFAGLLSLSTMTDMADPANSAAFGRSLFLTYSVTQMVVVALLAPLLVGLGVAEEREEGTLQLLLITRLSTLQILWGKIVSRLAVLASFVMGGLPVLALVASFGGVGPWEVVHATGNALLVALVLGTVGGVAALFSGGGAIALGAALLWAVLCWGIVPLTTAALLGANQTQIVPTMALFAPPAAMFETGWRGFAPLLTNLPVVLLLAALTTPLFRLVTTRSTPTLDGELEGDAELATAARVQRRIGVMALLVPLFIAASVGHYWLQQRHAWGFPKGRPSALSSLTYRLTSHPAFGDIGHGVIIGTAVLTMMLSAGAIALIQLRAAGLIAQAFGGGHGQKGSFASALRTFDTVVRPMRLPVWPLPDAWRETATRGLGAPAVLTRWLTLPMLAFVLFVICLGAMGNSSGPLTFFGWMLGFASLGITLVVSVSTFTTERQARTLTLMVTTTQSMPRLVLGKVLGVVLTTGTWVGASALLIGLGVSNASFSYAYMGYDPDWKAPTCGLPHLTSHLPAVDGLQTMAWFLAVWWLVLCASVLVGLRARPTRVAFPVLIGLFIAAPMAVLLGLTILNQDHLVSSFFPIVQSSFRYDYCNGDLVTVLATGLMAVMGTGLLGVLTIRARAWILADVRAS